MEGLLEEDDEIVETWYLLGWLNSLRAKDGVSGYNSNARFYLDKAARVHKTNPTDDMQMVKHLLSINRQQCRSRRFCIVLG